MFTPQELEKMPKEFEKLMNSLEDRVMMDVVRRLKINSEITRSADWQIYRLNQLGKSKSEIKKYIKEALELSDKQVDKLYEDAIQSGYTYDKKIYKATGKDFIPFKQNEELQQLITVVSMQTKDELKNITNSLGFAIEKDGKIVFEELSNYYQNTLDNAMMDIISGTFDYNTVLKRTVQEMTKSGLRSIDYASGYSNRIEVATRRAVMTGVTQVTNKITEMEMADLGTEYVEVSWHGTSRPSHQVWQGRVYSKEELVSVCGLGTGPGLGGWNCRHSYSPFVPGISERTYTDEQLDEMNKAENTPKEYNGKEYTKYEASQRQRKLETLMRKQRQDIKLLQEGEANKEDIITAQARYRITSDEYVKFSKAMELPQQMERVYGDGIKGKLGNPRSYKIIENRAKLYYNGNIEAYLKDETIRKHLRDNSDYNKIHWGRQEKHIKGTNNYIEEKSYFTIDKAEIEKIALDNRGTGYIIRDKNGDFTKREKIFINKEIGYYINKDDLGNVIEQYKTNSILICYSKDGIHIRPTRKE